MDDGRYNILELLLSSSTPSPPPDRLNKLPRLVDDSLLKSNDNDEDGAKLMLFNSLAIRLEIIL